MNQMQDFIHYRAPQDALRGKIIVVSGAGAGIGRCASLSFAQHGATVVLLGRTMSKLEAIYDEIENRGFPQAAIFPINFEGAAQQDYEQLANALENEFGRLDGLLHNASELGPRTPLESYADHQWQKVMQVNVTAPFMLTKSLLPLLRKSTDGRIVFTGSGVAMQGRAYWGAYAASKAAHVNLMQTLADELEQSSIRVNGINPGATRTSMRIAAYPAENPNSVTPPEQIMNRYLYLFGPQGATCHGLYLEAQPKGL